MWMELLSLIYTRRPNQKQNHQKKLKQANARSARDLASDREAWKDVCEDGLAAFDTSYDEEAEARRARRHTITRTPPASGPRCHICGRICASEFGLRSHLRSHRPSVS